jgi:hypothetical protein
MYYLRYLRAGVENMVEKANRSLVVKYEVPFTWLMGMAGTLAATLFYAGWQASGLKAQLEDAVRLGKEVVQRQNVLDQHIIDLKVTDQLTTAKIAQIEQRLNRVEK